MTSPCSPCMCVMGTCSQGWHHWMTSYWRSTHTQSWPGSKVAEASSLLLLILSLYTSLQMAQKRRRKCISHLIYFEFCLDVQIASEWNRMQGKLLYRARAIRFHTPHSVTTTISLHSSTSLIARKRRFLKILWISMYIIVVDVTIAELYYLLRGRCGVAAVSRLQLAVTFQRRGSAQCRQMSSRPTKHCTSPGMWRCEPISYVHCARAELFNCYNLDQSFFVPFLHWSSHSLPLHLTRPIPSPNEIEKRWVRWVVCRLRMLTSMSITKLCSPHHWRLEVTTKVREDFIQSQRWLKAWKRLLTLPHLRHYAKCALTHGKLMWNWDTLRI